MAPDIRSFFSGNGTTGTSSQEKATKARGNRKVLDDSDDDVPVQKKSTPKKASKRREATPEGEATTSADYFGKGKPKKSAPTKTKQAKPSPAKSQDTPKSIASTRSRRSTNNGKSSKKAQDSDDEFDDGVKVLDDDVEGDQDVFAAEYKGGRRGKDDGYEESEQESEEDIKPIRQSRETRTRGHQGDRKRVKQTKKEDKDFEPDGDVDMKDAEDDFVVPDEETEKTSKGSKPKSTAGRKRKSPDLEDESRTPAKGKGSRTQTPKKSTPNKKAKKEPPQESAAMKDIFDSIPLVRPPTPPGESGEKKKFPFGGGHANSGPPPAAGSKEIPEGAENCLAGLSFVFTGLLETLQREEGQNLVKRYGGKVMGAPSSKTSYVVLGNDAGPKKLDTIKKNNLKTINEDGLFELIRRLPPNGGDSEAATKHEEKKKEEEDKARKMAEEAEKEDKKAQATASQSKGPEGGKGKAAASGPDTRLWTVKHAPGQLSQICGNKTKVEMLQRWLRNFPKNQKKNFKLGGQDGSGTFRAVILSGPPGIGKTTAAHLVARLEGYDVVESNASDTRSKKLVEAGLKGVLDTTSLLGYFAPGEQKAESSKRKLVLIMDEVDGMSAGDRGGVGALASVCKKTSVPMILICNDRKLPKMRPFDYVTFGLPFQRPTTDQIRSRIMTIGFREGIKLPTNVINALIEGTGGDIRQVVNMVSAAKTDEQTNDSPMDYYQSKKMSKAWEKHIILRPWDIVGKILGGGMFASSSKATLNEKSELYFNDHELSPLMLQENYLNTNPISAGNYSGREKTLKTLEAVEQAANSISEGDLIDRMIHGTQQHWSLMPTHAIFSFVRPASFVAGSMAGHSTSFPSWLGKNSSQGKAIRQVKEIQGHMRLHSSGDRNEIRQQYMPLLWDRLVKRLESEGKECVPDVIELMDSYFLTKEDWDAVVELGVGEMGEDNVKIPSQAKATFTRLYNAQSHPLPFMKASNVKVPQKAAKEKPDLEEALDGSDEAEVVDDDAKDDDEEDVDLSKDKYVKQPKKSKASGKGKGKKKGKVEDETNVDGDEDDGEEESKPKTKGKGKASVKNRGQK